MSESFYLEPPNSSEDRLFLTSILGAGTYQYEEADFVISTKMPFGCHDAFKIQNIIDSYIKCNKKILIFLVTDLVEEFAIPENILLLRTSLLKSKKTPREEILPYIWEGISKSFEPLMDDDMPRVGFCGFLSHPSRVTLLDEIKRSGSIETNFIIRDQFWGGKPHDSQVVYEFNENIKNNHFQVCNRGAGNFSMRFYQTLSAGRIPILINTDTLLPFEDRIDWENLIIRGDTHEEVIYKIHNLFTSGNIVGRQIKCREVYELFFEPKSYFKNLVQNYSLNY